MRELIEKGASAPWGLVPVDVSLANADPEEDLYWEAATLYAFFDALDDVGDAIASKLLHLKRPAFFPILDSVLGGFYDAGAVEAYKTSERASRELPTHDRLYVSGRPPDHAKPQ